MIAWAIVTAPVWVPLAVIIIGGSVKLYRGKDWVV